MRLIFNFPTSIIERLIQKFDINILFLKLKNLFFKSNLKKNFIIKNKNPKFIRKILLKNSFFLI
jgi:hypothetical protein